MNLKNDIDYNYVEIVKINKIKQHETLFDISFSEDQFIESFLKIKEKYPRYFQKHSTKYLYDSLELYIDKSTNDINEKSTNVYDINMIYNETVNNKFVVSYYQKKNLPEHTFPSTTNIIDKIDIKRYSFKITNNIFINFECCQYLDGDIYKYIYINYNVNKTNDFNDINNIINDIISIL
jgi:hypothetical protein